MSATKTTTTSVSNDGGSSAGEYRFTEWAGNAVGAIESADGGRVVARYAFKRQRLLYAMSWITVKNIKAEGTAAADGTHYVQYGEGWYP